MNSFTVIIPFRNAAQTLPQCLEALAAQHTPPREIILIDNRSTDQSYALADAFIKSHPGLPVTLLSESTPGAAAARNRGAQHAQGKWLLFTDADCLPEPDWIQAMAEAVAEHADSRDRTAAIAGAVLPGTAPSLIGRFTGLFTLPTVREKRMYDHYTLVDGGFPTANFAIRKDLFERIGGFDITIGTYGEDHNLCHRIYAANHTIWTAPRAGVRHMHRHTLSAMCRQASHFGYSHALLLSRYSAGIWIIDLPFRRFMREDASGRIWVDARQADKKMLLCLIAALCCPLAALLPLLYYAFLCYYVTRRMQARAVPVNTPQVLLFPGLLLMKSASMTLGRLQGALRFGVCCL